MEKVFIYFSKGACETLGQAQCEATEVGGQPAVNRIKQTRWNEGGFRSRGWRQESGRVSQNPIPWRGQGWIRKAMSHFLVGALVLRLSSTPAIPTQGAGTGRPSDRSPDSGSVSPAPPEESLGTRLLLCLASGGRAGRSGAPLSWSQDHHESYFYFVIKAQRASLPSLQLN